MSDEDKKQALSGTLDAIRQAFDEADRNLEKLAEECPHEVKLAVTQWIFKNLVEHAREGGSYRYLIYDRLDFGPEAYVPLCADGLTISNEFDLELKPNIIKCLEANDIEGAKRIVGCCDEPGCFKTAGCGWPTDNKYRWTCGQHYVKEKKDA